MKKIYLDNAATTKLDSRVFTAMIPWLTEEYGNPSSNHDYGYKAKKAIENARENIADYLNCEPNEVFFTSGGSESNNTVINPKNFGHGEKLITTKIEHHSVLNAAKSLDSNVIELPVKLDGLLSILDLEDALKRTQKDRSIVSIMSVNNEIGTIQQVELFAALSKYYNKSFHTDAVQAFGKINFDLKNSEIDFLSASAHKIHGPKGIGLLYVSNKKLENLHPLINGGQQERGFRAGTECVANIVGFSKAIDLLREEPYNNDKMKTLKGFMIRELERHGIEFKLNCGLDDRFLGNILNIQFVGIDASRLIEVLNENGVYCSSGSACNSESNEPSHVLKAIGLTDKEANSSVRFSFDKTIEYDDIRKTTLLLGTIIPMLKEG